MKLRNLAWMAGAFGAATFVYGALYESRHVKVVRQTLRLPHWPEHLDGFRIALMADMHLRDAASVMLAKHAIALALQEEPDMVAFAGDFVNHWTLDMPRMLGEVMEPMLLMNGAAVAVPGNHDYEGGDASFLEAILGELNVKVLRNESWRHAGITWVGVDSFNEEKANPLRAMDGVEGPAIALWHEPDVVWTLPKGCALQLSGHSHGGQFLVPPGIAPMKTRNGSKYLGGFYPYAPTPLYVTRGVGTTFLPSRFMCPPEVCLLTIETQLE